MRIIRFKLSVIKKVLLLITVVILGIPVLLVSFSVFTFASYKIGEATGSSDSESSETEETQDSDSGSDEE